VAFKWSDNQNKAINNIGTNILVSAGAGSGKTAVLTERIFQLVKRGYPISRFLVLTFTNAAAAEMKSRIRDKLLSDKNFHDSLSDLEAAHIETFDAFALFIVKKYAASLNLSSDISIMDSSILNIQKNKIIDEIFDEFYRAHDKLFVEMIKTYCLKDDKEIKAYINRIIACADLQIDKASFYRSFVDQTYQEKVVSSYLDSYYQQVTATFSGLAKRAEELSHIDDSERLCQLFDQLMKCQNYDELYDAIHQSTFPRKPNGYPGEDEQIRSEIALAYKEIKNNDFGKSQDVIQNFLSNKPVAELLMKMAHLVDERFTYYKENHQSYDFSDIARMALTILKIPEISDEVKKSFDFIMVDEYQDTSDVQEKVIASLDRNNVYMVGDVKQSIYRFRNANCQIFQKKFVDYKTGQGGEEIDLNQSFRSRREIVDFINDLFENIMIPENNIINYQEGHHFVFEPSIYQDFVDHHESYIPRVYRYSSKKSLDNVEQEMAIIADDILDKIHQHYQVYDKTIEGQPMRDCTYRDFAIIMDRGTEFDSYHRYFSEKGIPLHVVNDETINDSTLGMVTKNLVKLFYYISQGCYENEYKHAFVSIARSFLVQMSDQEIYDIITHKLYQASDIHQKIASLVKRYGHSSLYEILHGLYRTFDIYGKIIYLDHLNNNANNLETFLTFAQSMDNLGFSLGEFASYFDDLSDYQMDVKFPAIQENNDSVTLINIHKSKGLEYPIVYLSGLYKRFNQQDMRTSFFVSPLYGLSFPSCENKSSLSFISYLIKQHSAQEDFEEKLRLFYVATTRARERLIFLSPISEKPFHLANLRQANSFNDFLNYTGIAEKQGVNYVLKKTTITPKTMQNADKTMEIKEISLPSILINKGRASHAVEQNIDSSLLEFGEELHRLLEALDYENKDLSFIKNPLLQRCAYHVLNSSLFKDVKNDQLRHEFAFFDEIHHIHGIIDCLIITDQDIKIIDFKLKNIDDEKYQTQLRTYRDYLKTITALPIHLYLLSAMTGEEKEID